MKASYVRGKPSPEFVRELRLLAGRAGVTLPIGEKALRKEIDRVQWSLAQRGYEYNPAPDGYFEELEERYAALWELLGHKELLSTLREEE